MELKIEIQARPGPGEVEIQVINAWMNGEECVIGSTEIVMHEDRDTQLLVVTADLAVKS